AVIQNGVLRVHKRHGWKCSSGRRREKLVIEFRYPEILCAPERQERHIRIVIIRTHARGGKFVPNRGQRRKTGGIAQTIGLCGVEKEAVRKRRPENGSKVVIAGGIVSRQRAVKRNVRFSIVANRVDVVASCTEK